MLRRVARAAVAVFTCLLPYAALAQNCVWFGSKDLLSQVPAAVAAVANSVPASDAQAMAANGQDCGLWVLGRTELRRYGATGALDQRIVLKAVDKRLELATHMAVDPYDGSIWLAGNKILAHLSGAGIPLALPAFEGAVRDLAVGLDQSLWLVGTSKSAATAP